MKRALMTLASLVVCATASTAGFSDESSLTCKQTEDILNELRAIRKLLEAQGERPRAGTQLRAQTISVDVSDAPFLGSKDAPVAIVQFTDFQCPYCNRFYTDVLPAIKKNYIDSGKVRFYSVDFPLTVHPNALVAAEAGRCAAEQNMFWPMHDLMQGNPRQLEVSDLIGYAHDLGMNAESFEACVSSRKYEASVKQGAANALAKGIRGTPAMVIGRQQSNVVEGDLIVGVVPYETIDARLTGLTAVASAHP